MLVDRAILSLKIQKTVQIILFFFNRIYLDV